MQRVSCQFGLSVVIECQSDIRPRVELDVVCNESRKLRVSEKVGVVHRKPDFRHGPMPNKQGASSPSTPAKAHLTSRLHGLGEAFHTELHHELDQILLCPPHGQTHPQVQPTSGNYCLPGRYNKGKGSAPFRSSSASLGRTEDFSCRKLQKRA